MTEAIHGSPCLQDAHMNEQPNPAQPTADLDRS